MTAAGVQYLDSTGYVPPPASVSTAKASGAKSSGITSKQTISPQASGASGQPSDFQSEFAQQTDSQGSASSAAPATGSGASGTSSAQSGSAKDGSSKTGSGKTASGKPEKKRDEAADDLNPGFLVPVQVAEPQKQILPLSVALPQPEDEAALAQSAKSDEKAQRNDEVQGASHRSATAMPPSIEAVAPLPELQQPVVLKQFVKTRPSAEKVDPSATQNATQDPTGPTVNDLGKVVTLPAAPVPATNIDVLVRAEGQRSENSPHEPAGSTKNLPLSLSGFKLPASPAEPAAASGVSDTVSAAPSSPPALAFAARISSTQQADQKTAQPNADQPDAVASTRSGAISASQTPVKLPMKHAATAQIIPRAASLKEPGKEPEADQDELKRDAGPAMEKLARPDTRTDMVLPRFETSSEPALSSSSQGPQQSAPTPRTESILEPPAAPAATPHDIRVRVPDSNGGSTHVRFVESGGEVKVSVRTADDGLAQNLRAHLNDLTQRLSDGGMPAEIWRPAASSSSSQTDQQASQQDGRGSGGQGSGSHGEQRERQQQRPAWLEEMEASLHGERN
jgi:hypothetical protein